ncbi:MAG TPA: ATP-dependent helicase [Aggregatilineales bacterium]|nr:ATP-dependent helicase [Chloroflexota bacterium]HOA22421.1 ATP-dependent helicase [Aggregatilineales bacterium]HPV06456.1 ATP-dependent helicase [Aggregatilineales bacterium]HQE19238.1 ATP-dependent helicase [Aggregatilineales bacterium]
MTTIQLRESQKAVVAYEGGKMGVSAVPGSGKTFTLSYLAASLVERLAADGRIDEQEVLIVTFTNPAVNTFRKRIARLVQQERGLLPYVGYRVRTLHGLANDIVRMRPGLVGLADNFDILDERVTQGIIRDLAEQWVRGNYELLLPYLDPMIVEDENQLGKVLRSYAVSLVEEVASEIIRLGKDNRWEPDEMLDRLDELEFDLPLARIGVDLYAAYQRALSYRGAVDFDDLVRLAMTALETDKDFLKRLRKRWPYILEDEAQDSSQLQNRMLELLSGGKNWVRVGDPNQAIYTTFTTADSNLLRAFLKKRSVAEMPLKTSGRSSEPVIRLANYLVEWTSKEKTLDKALRKAFYSKNVIEPTEPGDPQPNPPDGFVYIDWEEGKDITPEQEIRRVVQSLESWLPDHQDWTVAVLVPENSRGFKLAEALKERGIPYEELLRSTSATRDAASKLQLVFEVLAEPTDARLLARLYREVWWPLVVDEASEEMVAAADEATRALRKLRQTEDFLWPGDEGDWLDTLEGSLPPDEIERLGGFRQQVQFWLQAAALPVDQLMLTISQELFDEQADLALGHKLAVVLGTIADNNPDYRLPELAQELRVIAQNERRFLGFDDVGEGYEPTKGVVTVATMHAAKGLEWDRVYLMSVNNYSFPAAHEADRFIAEKWFVRDRLNLQAETRRQVELMMAGKPEEYKEGEATRQARLDYAAERLRLLYVGITRARRDLIITWNVGRFAHRGQKNGPAAALIGLKSYWERELKARE